MVCSQDYKVLVYQICPGCAVVYKDFWQLQACVTLASTKKRSFSLFCFLLRPVKIPLILCEKLRTGEGKKANFSCSLSLLGEGFRKSKVSPDR
ncbi:MAG: hypothetical protein CV045_12155 [Cyanobacteria bacterium M5B4]|nr:MAG: hypothetical protein CV045_12155 [Cyanobacteria bacterium M5B4]